MNYGKFTDEYRGNGWHISGERWTIAFRRRLHFYFVRVSSKPGVMRLYLGFIEIEYRAQQRHGAGE
jgi:hypothetical protein